MTRHDYPPSGTTRLRLATADALPDLLPLVRAFHAIEGVDYSDEARIAAVRGLLDAPNVGRIWFIDVAGEPIGYIAICFGYSIEFGGRDGFIDEVFVREDWRGKGIGRIVLELAGEEVRRLGIMALHLEVSRDKEAAIGLYESAGFRLRDRYHLMSWRFGAN